MLEENDVQPESSPADVSQESSPVAPVETPTQQVVQTPEVPFNEHPRWKEVQAEREYLKQQLAAALSTRPAAPQPVEQDPYAGMSQEEKTFFQRVEQVAEKKIQAIVAQKEVAVKKELDETRQILATVAYERFQSKHPDVAANSQEEAVIAQLYGRGYSLDDAYKVAMFDKVRQQKEQKVQDKKVQDIKQKVAANVETSSIPASSGLPVGKKLTVREFLEKQFSAA